MVGTRVAVGTSVATTEFTQMQGPDVGMSVGTGVLVGCTWHVQGSDVAVFVGTGVLVGYGVLAG